MTSEYRLNDWYLYEHEITVPLDWDHPDDGRTIGVFGRVVADAKDSDKPYLVYLQGGPGVEAPRVTRDPSPSWLGRALKDYRVVMLDQRGTGRSTPVTLDIGATAAERAEYLTHLRAPSIVKDCEALREHLGVDAWSVLGQSFGGFTLLSYLSFAPSGLKEAYFTGGLSSVGMHPDDVYRVCYDVLARKSEAYYRRFPGDRDKMRRLMDLADDGRLTLPGGDSISSTRLRGIGHLLGGQGGPEALHWLLDLPFHSPTFAHDLAGYIPFGGRNPLYAVVHESCYADGVATQWSAERVLPDNFRADPTLLTGEHLSRPFFSENSELSPWLETAEILAEHPWPRLYDEEALRAAEVPCAAAVYFDDAYVNVDYSLQTASLLKNMHPWVTNEYEHNGLRLGAERVLDRLIGLVKGRYV